MSRFVSLIGAVWAGVHFLFWWQIIITIVHWTLRVERYVCFIDKRWFFNEWNLLSVNVVWQQTVTLSTQIRDIRFTIVTKQWQLITNSRPNQTSWDLYVYVLNNAILCLNLINTKNYDFSCTVNLFSYLLNIFNK